MDLQFNDTETDVERSLSGGMSTDNYRMPIPVQTLYSALAVLKLEIIC